MNEVQNISFHGQTVPVFSHNNQHYVAMKPICENIGLEWNAQFRRIKRNEILNSVVAMMATPSNGGEQQMICLPLDYLNGWLFGVDARRVKPEIRSRLLTYQRECFRVLNEYFNPKAIQPKPIKALPSGLTHEQQAEVKALHNILIQSVPFEKQKALAITLWSAVKSKFKVGYKDVPPEQFPEVLSLMARVAVEKGAQYREAEAVNLETVPKLFERQANIPFDLKRDAHYAVTVKNGRIYRHALSYVSMPHEDNMIPCLAHQV
nr:MAG TPA: hypothetical protein [Caudoviricetes sp.]